MDIPERSKRNSIPVFRIVGFGIIILLMVLAYARYASSSDRVLVDQDVLVIDAVIRSDFERNVRAPGRLIPKELRWVAATSNARVEEIFLDPGDPVERDTVVMKLSNPDLEEEIDSLRLELDVQEAEYRAMQQRLGNNRLTQESVVAEVKSLYELAAFRKQANLKLPDNVVSEIDMNQALLEEAALKTRYDIELRRLASLDGLHEAELAAKRSRINQAGRTLELKETLYDELQVRADFKGLLQDVPVEQGQQLLKGAIVARVADSGDLKAELRVQESQVKDVRPGQAVRISAGRNSAMATVIRIEPEVQDGVVIVDALFDEAPLLGARPDLRIEALIELEKIADTLVLKRPVFSQENVTLNLFVVSADGTVATRRKIAVGKTSTEKIQIVDGLQEGELVVVSDVSEFNELDEIDIDRS